MLWSIVCLLFIAAGLSPVLHGDEIGRTAISLQNGHAATLTGRDFSIARDELIHRLTGLSAEMALSSSSGSRCARYVRALRAATSSIASGLLKLEPDRPSIGDEQVLLRARLYLLIPTYFGLHALFTDEREGGFSLVDARKGETCPWQSRERLATNFTASAQLLAEFEREGMGSPGLSGFDDMINRLLWLAKSKNERRAYIEWGMLAATTVISIIFWEFGPPALMLAARAALGAVPPVVQAPLFVFGIRSATLTAEAFTYKFVDDAVVPPELPPGETIHLGTWEEQLKQTEWLLESPLESPELYAVALTQIEAQLALFYEHWLQAHRQDLSSLRGPP